MCLQKYWLSMKQTWASCARIKVFSNRWPLERFIKPPPALRRESEICLLSLDGKKFMVPSGYGFCFWEDDSFLALTKKKKKVLSHSWLIVVVHLVISFMISSGSFKSFLSHFQLTLVSAVQDLVLCSIQLLYRGSICTSVCTILSKDIPAGEELSLLCARAERFVY